MCIPYMINCGEVWCGDMHVFMFVLKYLCGDWCVAINSSACVSASI